MLAVGLLVFSFQSLSAEKTENEKLIAIQKVEIIDKPALMVGMAKTYRMSDDYYIGAMYLDQNVQSFRQRTRQRTSKSTERNGLPSSPSDRHRR